jgi:hypothetical protein
LALPADEIMHLLECAKSTEELHVIGLLEELGSPQQNYGTGEQRLGDLTFLGNHIDPPISGRAPCDSPGRPSKRHGSDS